MAPTNSSVLSVSSQGGQCQRCGGARRSLPISRRGQFFQDSFFSSIQQDFDATVRGILDAWNADLQLGDRWGSVGRRSDDLDHHEDVLQRYRQVRSRHRRDESQATATTLDDTSYKVTVDVRDFLGGDVRVAVVGQELVVEGRINTSQASSSSMQRFQRRVALPRSAHVANITSSMSSDGILTVIIPRLSQHALAQGTRVPIIREDSEDTSSSTKQSVARGSHSAVGVAEVSRLGQQVSQQVVAVSRQGSLVQDAAFKGVHTAFFEAVMQTIRQHGVADNVSCSDEASFRQVLQRFRQLRNKEQQETRAVARTADVTCQKIMFDVEGMKNVGVKVEGDAVVVEGQEEGQGSPLSPQQWEHRVPLGRLGAPVTAAVSSEGVLVLTLPPADTTTSITNTNQATGQYIAQATATSNNNKQLSLSATTAELKDSSAQESSTPVASQGLMAGHTSASQGLMAGQTSASHDLMAGHNTIHGSVVGHNTSQNSLFRSSEEAELESGLVPVRRVGLARQDSAFACVRQDLDSAVGRVLASSPENEDNEGLVPVRQVGLMRQDSAFANVRQDLNSEVGRVLASNSDEMQGKIDEMSDAAMIGRYRNLRAQRGGDDTRAEVLTTHGAKQVIVLDVHDIGAWVDVRVEGGELVVEGRMEDDKGAVEGQVEVVDGRRSNRFTRRFALEQQPSLAAITAALSSDGFLAITVPSAVQGATVVHDSSAVASDKTTASRDPATASAGVVGSQDTKVGSLHAAGGRQDGVASKEHSKVACGQASEASVAASGSILNTHGEDLQLLQAGTVVQLSHEDAVQRLGQLEAKQHDDTQGMCVTDDDGNFTVVLDVCEFGAGQVGVRVEDLDLVVEAKSGLEDSSSSTSASTSSHVLQRRFPLPPLSDVSDIASSVSSDGILMVKVARSRQVQQLDIAKGGAFLEDPRFSFDHAQFQSAAAHLLSLSAEAELNTRGQGDLADVLDGYRQLRSRGSDEDTRASCISSDNTRFVVDLQDFVGGDVRAWVTETALVVEAISQQATSHEAVNHEGSAELRTFRRRFELPQSVDASSVAAAMSADGILSFAISATMEQHTSQSMEVSEDGTTYSAEAYQSFSYEWGPDGKLNIFDV